MSDQECIKRILDSFTRRETGEETRQKFRQWITDPEERKEKDQALEALWNETRADFTAADEAGWERLATEIAARKRHVRLRLWRRTALGAAAVLILGLFVAQHLLLSKRIERAEQDRTLCYVKSEAKRS